MLSHIPKAYFSTDKLKASQKYDAFLESMGVIFQVSNPHYEKHEFYGRIKSLLFGEIMLVECDTCGQAFLRTPQMIAKDSMDHFLFQFFLLGATWDKESSTAASLKGREILVLDASQTWNALTNDFINLTLVIPRRLISKRLHNEDAHHKRTLSGENPFAKLLRDHILNLRASADLFCTTDIPMLTKITLELASALLNRGANKKSEGPSLSLQTRNYLLKMDIKAYLEKNIHDPKLTADFISEKFNISRSHLYNVFNAEDGIAQFIKRRRMTLAYRRLCFSKEEVSISQVARSVGYENLSSFSRAFRSEFDVSPTDIKYKNSIFSPYPFEKATLLQREWEKWLMDL